MSFRAQLKHLNAYDLHKTLINEYFLIEKGATSLLKRDSSKDKRDIDVIRENHQFLWDDDESVSSWEKQLAKKYYDKLFKEYCISDLSMYKENKVGLRWRTETELIDGKGQFVCGNKKCSMSDELKSWEVNFSYLEHGDKKNALVKLRLCPPCSKKLNYHHKRKEVKRLKRRHKKDKNHEEKLEEPSTSAKDDSLTEEVPVAETSTVWEQETPVVEEKSRDEEFEEFLDDLFL